MATDLAPIEELATRMEGVLGLTFPFFGLIFLGFFVGKIVKRPESGLAWLNVFIIYIALPALFFRLLSETPIEELNNLRFIAATTFATYVAFALAFLIGYVRSRGDIPQSTIQGLVGGYGNIGYLGPGLALTALGPQAAVPVALIFCFDNTLMFVITPILMALAGTGEGSAFATALQIVRRIVTHPFIVATVLGILAAAFEVAPPGPVDRLLTMLATAAAPCALFAMGVTVALRPVPPASAYAEVGVLLAVKMVLHPLLVFALLLWVGGTEPLWIAAAVLMAALPPATNVFVLATQYGSYIERASNAVLIGTGLSVLTLTALIFLLKTESGLIPGTG